MRHWVGWADRVLGRALARAALLGGCLSHSALAAAATGDEDPGELYARTDPAAVGARALVQAALPPTLSASHPRGTPRYFQPIEDPTGHALDHFYAALARTDAGVEGALTRVSHMGDSSIGLDGLPHAIRRRMQDRFGDGGAGFVLLTRYSPNYNSRVVRFGASGQWDVCYIAYRCRSDGRYGLGGHVFRGKPGARAKIQTRRGGTHGTRAAHLELWYATSPHGGRATFGVSGGAQVQVNTRASAIESRWADLDVEPGPQTVSLRIDTGRYVWAYGIVSETEGPGVVWDTMSMIGVYTPRLAGYDDAHIAEQVAHRDANLLVLNYGGNDLRRLVAGRVSADSYRDELAAVVAKLRRGKPEMSCLVIGVIDHGRSGSRTVRRRHTQAMVQAQRDAAFASGCAFFDSVAVMGGAGSIRAWREHDPPLAEPDLKHLSVAGRDLMGGRVFAALLAGYEAYAAVGTEPDR